MYKKIFISTAGGVFHGFPRSGLNQPPPAWQRWPEPPRLIGLTSSLFIISQVVHLMFRNSLSRLSVCSQSMWELFNGIKSRLYDLIKHNHNIQAEIRLSLDSERGIFILTCFKRILDKLIYFDKFGDIDLNLSDPNKGGEKTET